MVGYVTVCDITQTLMPPDVWSEGQWVGNRVATVMFYLSDLLGGRTAFPKLGVAAAPRARTAVFWSTLHRSGERDERSLHGACPTLLGIKWVSNKGNSRIYRFKQHHNEKKLNKRLGTLSSLWVE